VKEMAENVWIMLAVRLRSAVSGISQHLVRGREEAEFFSKKIVLLQTFVIQFSQRDTDGHAHILSMQEG
jgi:hypothetical protein